MLDLQNELERLTAVPVKDQRLYFKSKELNQTPHNTLKECQLENNHVVKLVGEPSKLSYSQYFGRTNVPQPNSLPYDSYAGGQQFYGDMQGQNSQPFPSQYQPR